MIHVQNCKMALRDIIAIYCEKHAKLINTVWPMQNVYALAVNVRVATNGHSIVKRESNYLHHSPCRERTLSTISKRTENFIRLVFHTREIASGIYRVIHKAYRPGRPVRFAAHRQPLCWNSMYHSRIVLSVGGSVWYMIRNLRYTVTIDSVLGNSKTQNAFLFTVNAIFLHD